MGRGLLLVAKAEHMAAKWVVPGVGPWERRWEACWHVVGRCCGGGKTGGSCDALVARRRRRLALPVTAVA